MTATTRNRLERLFGLRVTISKRFEIRERFWDVVVLERASGTIVKRFDTMAAAATFVAVLEARR